MVPDETPGIALPHRSTIFSSIVADGCSGPSDSGVASEKASALVVPARRVIAGWVEIAASAPLTLDCDQTAKVCVPRPAGESGGRPEYVKTTFSPGL